MPKPYNAGRVHVRSEMCSTCIFRSGNLMQLQPGRVADMVREAKKDSSITCHSTLYGARNEQEAVCRGFWDRHRSASFPLRMAEAMDMVTWVE